MKMEVVLVRSFLTLWVLVFLILKAQETKAAECCKSTFARFSCSPCGRGTRCAFCNWCLGYCHNKKRIQQRTIQNGTEEEDVEVPYKQSFIEMFEDLKSLIIEDEISNIDVVEFYKVTYFILREDCMSCDYSKEMEELRDETISIHRSLKKLMKSETNTFEESNRMVRTSLVSREFKRIALQNTREVLITTDKIPKNLTAKVDSNSSVAVSFLNTTATITTKGKYKQH